MLLYGILAPMLQARKLPRGIRWVDSEWSFGVTAPPTLKPRITQERPFRLLFSGFHKVIEVYEDDDAGKPIGYIAVIMPLVTADGLDPLAEKTIACQEQEKNGQTIGSTSRTSSKRLGCHFQNSQTSDPTIDNPKTYSSEWINHPGGSFFQDITNFI